MSRKMARSLMLTAFVALTPVLAFAQLTASTTATSSARVIRGIGMARTQDLYFGDIFSPLLAGTVTVSPASVRTPSPTVTVAGGTVSAASFTVSDNTAGNPKFWVQLPLSIVITGGGDNMTVSNFTANVAPGCVSNNAAPPPGPPGGCPNSNANYVLNVGAQLSVKAGQLFGAYTGTFQVSVHRF